MATKPESPYIANPNRLTDVIAAIQAMAVYEFHMRTFDKWAVSITGDESKADYWKKIFEEHPEFFRLDTTRTLASLVWPSVNSEGIVASTVGISDIEWGQRFFGDSRRSAKSGLRPLSGIFERPRARLSAFRVLLMRTSCFFMNRNFATMLTAAAATSIFATSVVAQPAPQSLSSSEIAAKAAVRPPFSEERNAAAGYVAAQTFYIGRMALTCKPLLEQADSFPSDMVAKWRTANLQYARATAVYLSDLLKSVPDPVGAQALAAHINGTIQRNGQEAVNDAIKGTDEERKTACMKFVINFASNGYDITEKSPFFATLKDLVSKYGR